LFSDVETLRPQGKAFSDSASLPKGETPPEDASVPKGAAPQTLVYNTFVTNEGCNFGEVSTNVRNDTQIALEHVMNVAQEQHNLALYQQANYAEAEHQRQMSAALHKQAQEHALGTNTLQRRNTAVYAEAAVTQTALADYTNENQQLKLALETQKIETNEVQQLRAALEI
jgi:hypothetical protein